MFRRWKFKLLSRLRRSASKLLIFTEAKIEEFFRKNTGLIFDEEDEEETLLIVGQQVANLSGARNDLVALDGSGNLVLIEIKRDATDIASRKEAMEFQAVRYAASLATIRTVDDLVDKIFSRYIDKWKNEFDLSKLTSRELGKRLVDEFLKQNNADNSFNKKQRIILLAGQFDDQTLSAAAWMAENGMDISCISLNPFRTADRLFLSTKKLIPTRPAQDFFIGLQDVSAAVGSLPSKSSGGKKARTILPRMPELIDNGIVSVGDKLQIKNHPGSEATVVDARTVKYKGDEVSFNEWGGKVTGWSSINIYDWALKDNKTLADLRSDYMEKMEIYPVHVTTRKSLGLMMRKLSVTESQRSAQFRGTVSRRNPSVASANWAQVT